MSYCPTHGTFDDYFSRGCPTCRDADDRAELDREEMRDALSEIANSSANLGDYVCPFCMQTSIRTGASRCPLCRGEIGGDYWKAIRARDKAEAERRNAASMAAAERQRAMDAAAAAEYIRTAPEREAAAERAALAVRRAVRAERLQHFAECLGATIAGAIIGVVAGFLIGILVFAVGSVWWMGEPHHKASMLAHNVAYIVVAIGTVCGAVLGWVRPWKD